MMSPMPADQAFASRSGLALATLGLPLSLVFSIGFGFALMVLAGCEHLAQPFGLVGGSLATVSVGVLVTSLGANAWRSFTSVRQVDKISIEVDDEERLEVIADLAARLNVRVPTLRVVLLDTPLAFSVLGSKGSVVVSTWVFDHLTDSEFEALMAHELAHMRQRDRMVRWMGAWLWKAVRGVPGIKQAWSDLDTAMEDAADEAAIQLLGNGASLESARRKYLSANGDIPSHPLSKMLKPLCANNG